MSAKVDVSVIIPCYNTEKFLAQAMDSALSQSGVELEFICVNDGSTDGTLAMLEKYAAQDPRVKIISQPNGGYGKAMNTGMDAACGKYMAILEPDDYIEKDMYSTLFALAEQHHLDFVKSDFHNFYCDPEGKPAFTLCKLLKENNYNIVRSGSAGELFHTFISNWTGIYRLEYLRLKNIRHNESPGASYQDAGFMFQAVFAAGKYMVTENSFYRYRIDNPNSSVKKLGSGQRLMDEYEYIEKCLKDKRLYTSEFAAILRYKQIDAAYWLSQRVDKNMRDGVLEYGRKIAREAWKNGEIDLELFKIRNFDFLRTLCPELPIAGIPMHKRIIKFLRTNGFRGSVKKIIQRISGNK